MPVATVTKRRPVLADFCRGLYLTDGEILFECRSSPAPIHPRGVCVRLVDATDPPDAAGAWVPIAEALELEVVRPALG